MTTPFGQNSSLIAQQEAKNQQVLRQMAQREAQAAAQLQTMATGVNGASATHFQQLAQQESQNQQMLQQLAQREAQAAAQLSGATATGSATATDSVTAAGGATATNSAAPKVQVPNLFGGQILGGQ